jgi:hypothetical protein
MTERHVTPYIHMIVCHTCDIMKKTESSFSVFSQQGFEATHKWHKAIYFHSTSHDGQVTKNKIVTSSIHQIMVKIYRIHFLERFDSVEECKQMLNIQ